MTRMNEPTGSTKAGNQGGGGQGGGGTAGGTTEQLRQTATEIGHRLRDMAERFVELFEDNRDFDYHFPLLTAASDISTVRDARPVKQLGLF